MGSDAVAEIVSQWRAVRPDLDTEPLLVIGRILRLADLIDARLRPPFAQIGLGNGDFDVLTALRRAGAPFTLSPTELAKAMLVTSGAVTKRVGRLEARGHVTRDVSTADARGRRVTLTASGLDLVDRLMEAHLDNERALLATLSAPERDRLAALLGRLASSVEKAEE